MRLHLATIEGMEQFGEDWTIAPLVPLRNLPPDLLMPMAGDDIELIAPDGRVLAAHVVSFGISAWKDSEEKFYISTDPADPSLTLTIASDFDLSEVPPGTEVWLSDAKTSAESGAESDAP